MTKLLENIWNERELILYLAKSERKASIFRFFLGETWSLFVPLAQALIYYFLLTVVFASQGSKASLNLAIILMGIFHFSIFFQIVSLVLPSVYNGTSILLQVKFNPLILIASAFIRALQNWGMGIFVFLIYFIIVEDFISYKIVYYPLVLFAVAYFCWLLGVIVATAAVYIRDLEKMMPIVFQILMYLSPVIYPVSFYPADFAHILLLNPTASLMAILQWSLFGAEIDLAYSSIIVCFWLILLSWVSSLVYRLGSKHFTKTL